MEALIAKFKKFTTVQLIVKVEKASGDEKEAILQVLEARNQDTSTWRGVPAKPKVVEFESEVPLTPDEEAMLAAAEKKGKIKSPKVKKEKTPKVKKERVKKEKAPKTPKEPKTAPREDSKSVEILALLKEGKLSKYAIAKQLNTYYSVVDYVAKRYTTSTTPETSVPEAEKSEDTVPAAE